MTISELRLKDAKNVWLLWASGFGLGFLPKAPGTWGSAAAVFVWWFFLAPLDLFTQLGVIATYFLVSVYACHRVCVDFAVKDAGEMVADEIVGMWLALLVLPQVLWIAVVGFVLFRIFDIKKPWLVGYLDKNVAGGLGVILDDVIAGLMTCACLWGLVFTFRALGITAT